MGKAYETVYAFNLTIYYPYANFGAKIPNLLTAICGERLRQQPDIRLDHAKDDRPVVHVEHVPQALDVELRPLEIGHEARSQRYTLLGEPDLGLRGRGQGHLCRDASRISIGD